MKDYQPIDCDFHSELELAIMHKKMLKISWKLLGDGNEITELSQTIKPIDLVSRSHEEFLILEDEKGHRGEIRLDHIIDVSA